MGKHGCLWVTSSSRSVAEHVNVIGLWLELIQVNILVLSSMFDDLIDMHDGQACVFAILLNRIVIVIHGN